MESMNNKDPFENFLKNQSFGEKAPGSLLIRLEKGAVWNRPWWKSPVGVAVLAACLVVIMATLIVVVARSESEKTTVPKAEQVPVIDEPVAPPPQVIVQNDDIRLLSPFHYQQFVSQPEFNLSFIDRPVNYFEARREYADMI